MSLRPYAHILLFVALATPALAQDSSPFELLSPISPQENEQISSRYTIEKADLKYFAKEGKFGLFDWNLAILERKGAFTLTPFETSFELISHGLERNPEWQGAFMQWHGEIRGPNTNESVPIEWSIAIQAIDAAGNLQFPDRNRGVTVRELQKNTSTVLGESYDRRNEEIVYTLSGNFLRIPGTSTTLAFRNLGDQFDALVVYEVDESKTITLGDALLYAEGSTVVEDERFRPSDEQLRRLAEYEAYMENVRGNVNKESQPE